MVRLLIGATVLASAGLAFGPATSASADGLCYGVGGTGVVNEQVGPVCVPFTGSFCDNGQVFLGNPETLSYEACIPSAVTE